MIKITLIWNTSLNEIIELILTFNNNKIKTRVDMRIYRRRSKWARGRRWMRRVIRDRLKVIGSKEISWLRLDKLERHINQRKRFSFQGWKECLMLHTNLWILICHLLQNMLLETMWVSKPLQSTIQISRKKWISTSQFSVAQIDSKNEEAQLIPNHDLLKIILDLVIKIARALWKLEDSE